MTGVKGSTAYLFFLAAFPGYFFYHVLKSTMLIPYVGWFSVTMILCTAVWIMQTSAALVANAKAKIAPGVSIPFWSMILLMISFVVIQSLFNEARYITLNDSVATAMVTVWLVALYEIGQRIEFKTGARFDCFVGVVTAAFAISAIVFFSSDAGVMIMPVLDGDSNEAANYQGMARSVMCFAVVLFPFIRIHAYRIALTAITAATLYVIGSRTELALYLLTIPIYVLVSFRKHGIHPAALAVLLSVGVLLCAMLTVVFFASGIDAVSVVESYLSSDASLNERAILLEKGMEGVFSSPVIGDYLGQVREFGQVGAYIHNVLSMWQQFGIFGLAIYAYLIVMSAWVGWCHFKAGKISPHAEALIALSIASIIGVLTTKSFFWPIPALAWGLAARLLAGVPRIKRQAMVTSP